MLNTYLQGFAVSLSLIIAIGAQNAFVLKQGLKKQSVFWVCFACALSDSILIAFGVAGFSAVLQRYPEIIQFAKWGGAVFFQQGKCKFDVFLRYACLKKLDFDQTPLTTE